MGWIKTGAAVGLLATTSLTLSATAALADVQAGVVKYEAGDFSGAIQEWLPLAAQNDPNALFNLGQVYRLGRGVDKDMPTARNYYERAARLGHVSAQGNLGTLYYFAESKALKDQEKAVSWWQEAATNGDARSQYMLGVLFFNGDVVDRDWTRAYAWMGLAASSGLPEASQAETSMLKHMTAAQVADAREISLTLVNPTGAFPNSMPVQFAKSSAPVNPAKATPVSAVQPAAPAPQPVQEAAMAEAAVDAPEPAASTPEPVTLAAVDTAPVVTDVPYSDPEPADYDPLPDPVSDYSYKLQLAAFSSEDGANNGWTIFTGKHGDVLATLAPDVVEATVGERTLYRLYANGFVTKSEARAACDSLKAQGQGCLVVSAD